MTAYKILLGSKLSRISTFTLPDVLVTFHILLHTLYYIKNQLDATLAVLFISHCKMTQHVSEAFCVHHQEY